MWIDRAYKVRLEPTKEQEQKFFAWTGVRKFAYNDAYWRTQHQYAYDLLSGKQPIHSVFNLRNIGKFIDVRTTYKKDEETDEWVFSLIDGETKETLALRGSVHGFVGKHPKPDAGFQFLLDRKHRIQEPLDKADTTLSKLRHREDKQFIFDSPALVYREAVGDFEDAYKKFFDGLKSGRKTGYPRPDNGATKRCRMQPGGAVNLGVVMVDETDRAAILRLSGNYVENSDDIVLGELLPGEDIEAAIARLNGERVGMNKGKRVVKKTGPRFVYKNVAIRVTSTTIVVPGLGRNAVKLSRRGYLPTKFVKYSQIALSYKGGHWFASLTAKVLVDDPKPRTGDAIGVDVGWRHLLVDSNGKAYVKKTDRDLRTEKVITDRIARLNRQLSRQKGPWAIDAKGGIARGEDGKKIRQTPSHGWKKTSTLLSKLYERLANIRNDLRHKATSELVYSANKNSSRFRVEDIDAKQMMLKSPTGTAHQKRMRKVTIKIGFGEVLRQIEYKANWAGSACTREFSPYTSKQCKCGKIIFDFGSKELLQCKDCGFGITHGTEVPTGADLPTNHRDFVSAVTLRDWERNSDIRISAWANRPKSKVPTDSGELRQGGSKDQKSDGSKVTQSRTSNPRMRGTSPSTVVITESSLDQSVIPCASSEAVQDEKSATVRNTDANDTELLVNSETSGNI